MGLRELVARLDQDASARVRAIEAAADAEVAAICAEQERFTQRARDETLQAARATRHAKHARELGEARRRVRVDVLRAQHAALEEILTRARKLLDEAAAELDPGYREALPRQVANTLRYVEGREVLVRCRPSLLTLVRPATEGAGSACEAVATMPVGFTITARDGSMDIDDTLVARLSRMGPRLAADLVREVER